LAHGLQPDEPSGASTPTAAPVADDVDFSDLKKKKKKSSKKAAFDLEAFEKELGGTPQEAEEMDEGVGEDENDLGEDPFTLQDGPAAVENGREPWVDSDREYMYTEVSRLLSLYFIAPLLRL
jgi:translation initiation factor 2 subunit 2